MDFSSQRIPPPQHTHPKLELLMGDLGTSDMSLSIILLPSHGVLCVVSRCVETTAVSPEHTVSLKRHCSTPSRIKCKHTNNISHVIGFWKIVCGLFHYKVKRNIFFEKKTLYHENDIVQHRCEKRSINFTNKVDMMFPWCCWNMR